MYKKHSVAAEAQPYSIITEVTHSNDTLTQLCSEGKLNDIKRRVDQGADIGILDSFGNSLAHTAAKHNQLDVLKWLVEEKNMDVHKLNRANRTILQIALESAHQSIVEWLVENRKSLKLAVTVDNLCDAVVTGNITVVKPVAKSVRGIYLRNKFGKTAIEIARQNNFPNIEHFLAKKTLFTILRENTPEYIKMQVLREHLDNQNTKLYNESVMQLSNEKSTSNQDSQYQRMYAVILAAKEQHMDIVKWLVKKGADPNTALESGSTLLAEINWSKDPENFKWLVNMGADIYSKDDSGRFALEKYVNEGNLEMIRWAVNEKKVDVFADNKNGVNLIALAVQLGKTNIVTYMIHDLHISVNEKLTDNKTLLHVAVAYRQEDIVKKLIEAKAEININDRNNKTPIDIAVDNKLDSIAEILVVSHTIKSIRNENIREEIKLDNLKKLFAKYGYHYLQQKAGSFKEVIAEAKRLRLNKIVQWFKSNETASSIDDSINTATGGISVAATTTAPASTPTTTPVTTTTAATTLAGSITTATTTDETTTAVTTTDESSTGATTTTTATTTDETTNIPTTPKRKEYNVLLIGETGVGKSTFINAFVNYINFNNLDDAAKSEDLYCLIPSNFAITDENYDRHVVTCGDQNENETFEAGQSSTQNVRSYSIVTDNTILRLIDTPGIGDTRGIEKDRENFDKLLKVIAELENIHAICVMLKPNNARLTVLFEYCIKELFAHLDKSASRNIVFLFTNSRGTFYRPGDSLPPLLRILGELKSPPTNITIPFQKENVFCMDNEAFRFLLAKKTKNVSFTTEEEADFATSWNKSAEVCRALIKYLVNLEPHKIQNSATINAAKRLVFALSKPLAEVAEHIDRTTLHLQAKRELIERNKSNIEVLKKNLHLNVPVLKVEQLSKPFTGCLNRSCARTYQILGAWHDIPRACHDPCFHTGIRPNWKGHRSIAGCKVLAVQRCTICDHTYQDHIHLYYKKSVVEEKLKDANLNLELEESTFNQATVEKFKRQLEKLNNQYKNEEETILKAMSKFSHFLKHNSLIQFHDVCKDYIQDLIDEEQKLGAQANTSLLITYQNILKKYEQYFYELENKFARTGHVVVAVVDVFQEINELYALQHFGETIKALSDAQMGLQKTGLLPDTKVEPRNNTFATFINSLE